MVKILGKIGYSIIDQKGSHILLRKYSVVGKPVLVVVPNHPELKIGTLISILRQARLSREDLEKLMK